MKNVQRIYFFLGALVIVASFVFAYTELVSRNNYIVKYKIPCDPEQDICFIEVCDPEVSDECTGNEDEDTSYYTNVYRNVQNIPACTDYESQECLDLLAICLEGESDCSHETCEQVQEEDDSIECSVKDMTEETEVAEETSFESE